MRCDRLSAEIEKSRGGAQTSCPIAIAVGKKLVTL
jgi:hypothetical protein